jgi:hypothetical protein
MGKATTFCLVVVGLINFVPVIGVVSAQKLESTYSITLAGNDLKILVRLRALFFGILGAFILYSAFNPIYQSTIRRSFGYLVLAGSGANKVWNQGQLTRQGCRTSKPLRAFAATA